jgi:hypothetical protein
MNAPQAGAHYPGSLGEFQAWFRSDADCLDYLQWLRWGELFSCPSCASPEGWRLGDGRYMSSKCGRRSSVTAGTIFDRTRTPLTVWFTACWMFATAKDGVSALTLQRSLGLGSYQTAWAMLHRLRSVLVRPGRERLTGTVELDETFIGGEEPGLRGGRARGKKALTVIAVEVRPHGLGRTRMRTISDASGESLGRFAADSIEPGATVITDGWSGYSGLSDRGYTHERRSQRAARRRGEDADNLLPGVHRVASLLKRWLLGTHQGSWDAGHLDAYLDEFAFRFNRRRSRSRGMVFFRLMQLTVGHPPVRYADLIVRPRPGAKPRRPPTARRVPESLDRPSAERPWRRSPAGSG